ncbi:MAG: pyrimidine dimer DNA glycosylase/endonuclease V [Gammaproteobacteria bacterium]|nr:pyrimidine dimer DNA glycosylase/endonuclease V [Gammaproteobacteria bacterium]
MRMWGVNPALLCDKHLLGEHVEMHMFAGTIRKGISTKGYEETGLVVLSKIRSRHNAIAREMKRRGMNHQSPIDNIVNGRKGGWIDAERNLQELKRRCRECRKRIERLRN